MDLPGDVGVWVSEHAVVLSSVVPDRRFPVVLSFKEHIVSNDSVAVNGVRTRDGRRTGTDGIEVASIVAVDTTSGVFSERVTAVVAHRLGTFTHVVMMFNSTISAIESGAAPVEVSPLVSGVVSAGVVMPVKSQPAKAFSGKVAESRHWHEWAEWDGVCVKRISHVNFVVHVLLSETCHRLLATHFNLDVGKDGFVGCAEVIVLLSMVWYGP